jgi:hypothetical protein
MGYVERAIRQVYHPIGSKQSPSVTGRNPLSGLFIEHLVREK